MTDKVRILVLTANPSDTTRLKLDQEMRAIDAALLRSPRRNGFTVESQWAVRVSDLQEHLLRYQPNIIHFCGHGSESSEIILENETGDSRPVPLQALSELFSLVDFDVKCVLLSACYSGNQAEAIAEYIDFVIGIPDILTDELSIEFSGAFYRALGYGKTIQESYALALNQIRISGFEGDLPIIYSKTKPLQAQVRIPIVEESDRSLTFDEIESNLDVGKGKGYCKSPNFIFEYELPSALQRGSCEIKFQEIGTPEISISLSHEDFLSHFLVGVNTHPSWNTRRFISLANGIYTFDIEWFRIQISETLAIELCNCVDRVATQFKNSLLETENKLEAWDSEVIYDREKFGYFVLGIPMWSWKLLKKFADEHQSHLGIAKWNIFQTNNVSMSIESGTSFHFELWPTSPVSIWGNNLPTGDVLLLYTIPSWKQREHRRNEWHFDIGPNGLWTVPRVRQWLIKTLIPVST